MKNVSFAVIEVPSAAAVRLIAIAAAGRHSVE
jgi:hypothetical protein